MEFLEARIQDVAKQSLDIKEHDALAWAIDVLSSVSWLALQKTEQTGEQHG